MAGKKRLGEMLIEKQLITEEQLDRAIAEQKQRGGRIGKNLVKLGFIGEVTLLKFLSNQMELPCADLSKIRFSDQTVALVARAFAEQHRVMPLDERVTRGKNVLFLAMSDPTNFIVLDELMLDTGYMIEPVIATDSQIESAIAIHYDGNSEVSIKPLKGRPPVINQEELKAVQVVTKAGKKEIEEKGSKEESPEVKALVEILIKKGMLTRNEYMEKLSQLKEL